MKYYHIIYTSSQKGLNGSNGFGIRTATEGTPREYLDAVVKGVADNKFANVLTNCKLPTPQELIETEGTAIRNVPPRYFFLPLDVAGGRRVYVLGRNIYVGFTETFYYRDKEGNILGKSGRMGTYLIDLYLFEKCPTNDAFQILYEQAKDGCNRFVPLDPSPNKNNFEMAALTTGDPVLLPNEEKKFTSVVESVSPKVVELILAILEAKISGRQLLIKFPWKRTHQLIADAFRLFPDEVIPQLSFSTNYTGNGFNAPANILFVNENYLTQYAGKGLFIDLESTTYQGDELKVFKNLIENSIRLGDYQKISLLVDWCLSDDFKKMGDVSADTKAIMFLYNKIPEEFDMSKVDTSKNRDELVFAMAKEFSLSKGKSDRFIEVLKNKVDLCNDINQIIVAVKDIDYYSSKGIDVSEVFNDQKKHINAIIMDQTEPRNAVLAINSLGLKVVRKYTDDLICGRERSDLAIYLLDIWKETIPGKLDAIKDKLLETKSQNIELYNMVLKNFSSIFSEVYHSLVTNISINNINRAKILLEDNLIVPFYNEELMKQDSLFQDFVLLFNIVSDNENYITHSNYIKATDIIGRAHLGDTKTGLVVKKFLIDNANYDNVARVIEQLSSIWHLNAGDIIRECQNSPMKKEIIKNAIEKSGFDLRMVLDVLQTNGIDNDFLISSKRYGNEYKSYKRKKRFSSFIGKLFGAFKRDKNSDNNPRQSNDPQSNSRSSSYNYSKNDKSRSVVGDNISRRREFYANRPKEEWPADLKMWIVVGLMSIWSALGAFAAGRNDNYNSYGDVKDAPKCYVVNAKTLNVRTSPSLYKGKRKRVKRKDNIGFKLNQGDTVFVSSLYVPMTADGVEWLGFTHEGSDYYTDVTKLYEVDNPRYLQQKQTSNEEKSGGFWGWVKRLFSSDENNATDFGDGLLGWLQRSAPTILMVLTIILFFLWSIGVSIDSNDTFNIRRYFLAEVRDDTGMRPMFMYSLRPYKSIAAVSLAILGCFIASIVIMLILGGVVWGLLWVVKLLLWILIIIGWILLIVGAICVFVNWGIAIVALIIGGLITYYQETLETWGNSCVAAGMAFFEAINVWQFSLNLIKEYWVHALIISLTPIILFLLAAALVFLVALCLRGYEAWTTHRYNVKHPCPWCHEKSEPAEYYDEDSEGRQVVLPAKLRPGIYGLLHITHPITGNKQPTLIANGRDTLARKCPHCGHFINFEAGTEKHIGFIGMPASGKTSLLCNVIGLMMKEKKDMHFTNTTDENIKEIQDNVDFAKVNGHLDFNHLPPKTGANWRASIQCILPRANGGMPYHIYFNDVAGELFTAGGNDKNLLRFSQDVENIVFIIDPWTMQLNEQKVSDRVKKWLKNEEVELMREGVNEEALNAFDSLVNALDSSKRDFAKINLTFAFVKSDTGYLESVETTDENALMQFMEEDLKLGNLIHAAETRFMSISYVAVSVFQKEDRGVQTLCNKLIEQLEIE